MPIKKKIGSSASILSAAKEVCRIEAEAIRNLPSLLTADFSNAANAILKTKGRVIVTGMGKSGNIGKKISATLASTGTPSLFVHPADANHGDLGMITKNDIVLAISYSGETEEIIQLLPYLKGMKIVLISMTGNTSSTLSKHSDYHINVFVRKEACPLQLAPTSSTTATLVMGDALAVALMKQRSFQPEDFAMLHPGGSLGKRLLTKVEHLMVKGNLPIVKVSTPLSKVISVMGAGRLGMAIVSGNKKLKGIITDGDLRRAIEKYKEKLFSLKAGNLMTKNAKTIGKDAKVIAAEELCNKHKITSLIVMEKQRMIGVFQIYNLAKV
ncbi:MAG: KpsF/GutQ family sugar-phosphate isomerase [Bacteroidetes bacterium]|nr:MAG: KpsF/GutQ family sugar-phosphate isomerase [Bacteroidota bacterium]